MIKDCVAVFDVCSSKISAMIGENGVNGNFVIRSVADVACEAFWDGEISDPDLLVSCLKNAFFAVTKTASVKVDAVYVSVGNQFLKTCNREYEKTFSRRKKLRKRAVKAYLDEAQSSASLRFSDYEVIDRRGVFFNLDGKRRTEDLVGQSTMSVRGYITYFLAKTDYLSLVRDVFSELGVKRVVFVPASIAEAYYLFSSDERFSFRILLDVGYITTELSVIYGGGLLYTTAFPTGGGLISAALCNGLNIDYELADRLKRRVNLSSSSDFDGAYEVTYGDSVYTFSQKKVNGLVRSTISSLAEMVDNALERSNVKFPRDAVVHLTGGGLSNIRGAKEYLFECIEMPVYIASPQLIYMSKPDETSKVALLDFALNRKGL